jgi:hypothetical protein
MRWAPQAAVLCLTICLCAETHTETTPPHALAASHAPLSKIPSTTKAVVLYFVATDCPISNRTFPEMRRLREQFASQAVTFLYVYPNQGETVATVRKHQAVFDPTGQPLLDDGTLTSLAHAVATPEAAVLTRSGSSWQPIYAGRIDDRYLRLGLERPTIQNHFVERVLNELLSGQPIEPAVGNPVGCAIMRPTAEKAPRR